MVLDQQWFNPWVGWGNFGSWSDYQNNGRTAGPTPDVPIFAQCSVTKPLLVLYMAGVNDWNYRSEQV